MPGWEQALFILFLTTIIYGLFWFTVIREPHDEEEG
jgi:hypothetical protein